MAEPDKKTRIPPNSKESEMMVLGSMLTSINSLNIAAGSLEESDFYFPEHQLVFQILKAAYTRLNAFGRGVQFLRAYAGRHKKQQ